MKEYKSLNIYHALIILMLSWIYTLIVNRFNFDDSIYKTYAFQGVPFALTVQVFLGFLKNKK